MQDHNTEIYKNDRDQRPNKRGNYTMSVTDRKTQYCEDVNSPQTATQLIIQEPFGFVLDT